MYLQTKIAGIAYIFIWFANQFDKHPQSLETLYLSLIFLVLVDICWKLNNMSKKL